MQCYSNNNLCYTWLPMVCIDSALKVSQVVKGEMSAKTTYQRSAKGPVSIAECSSDGKYICLENTGRKVGGSC
jgi:hypothetical protein